MANTPLTDAPLQGLPPVVDARATVLILGSFPSAQSLAAGQYYANPRNAFWPIVGEIFGFDSAATYSQRISALQSHGVALWDVLGTCRRIGSLDAAIDPKSLVPNDFAEFFSVYPTIGRVYFNGAKAASVYKRLVTGPAIEHQRLPSSSPAHTIAFARKLDAWKVIRASSAAL